MTVGLTFGAQDVRILEEEVAFSGHFKVRRLTLQHRCFGGGWSEPLVRELFERGDAVGVLPYDPVTDRLVLIEQFVVLLTSTGTTSGAEVFTLAMRALPQVTLIGEPTQGAISDKLQKQLTNGFEVGLSNEYYLSPEGDWFESAGIPVAVEVPQFDPALREQGVDAGLEAAAAFLLGEEH